MSARREEAMAAFGRLLDIMDDLIGSKRLNPSAT